LWAMLKDNANWRLYEREHLGCSVISIPMTFGMQCYQHTNEILDAALSAYQCSAISIPMTFGMQCYQHTNDIWDAVLSAYQWHLGCSAISIPMILNECTCSMWYTPHSQREPIPAPSLNTRRIIPTLTAIYITQQHANPD
jgi:hypothetical protein